MEKSLLAQRLKELRKVNNFTQDYVASAVGVIRQTYSHYESGLRTPSSEMLYKLAGVYGVSANDLLQLTIELDRNVYFEAPGPTQSSEELAAYLDYFSNPANQKKYQYNSKLEKEILYYFEKISEIDKKELIEIAKIKTHRPQ